MIDGKGQRPKLVKYGNTIGAVNDGVDSAFLEIITRTVTQAKALVPVKYGLLGASIQGSTVLDKTVGLGEPAGGKSPTESVPALTVEPRDHEGYVGSAVEYAPYQEFGTRFNRASPFLRPAIQLVASPRHAAQIIAKYNSDEVREAVRKGPKKEESV